MSARSAREVAYETIRSRIITMELKPGDELNDRELAQELGISRTPMREALIMLNIAHMVTIKPQSGTHVAPIDLKLMEMEQFARFTLEKEILNHPGHPDPGAGGGIPAQHRELPPAGAGTQCRAPGEPDAGPRQCVPPNGL